jgi:ankyrin repeat protein
MATKWLAATKRDHLSRLPNEILHEICDILQDRPGEYTAAPAVLCQASRTLKAAFEERLYTHNVRHQNSSALFWGAFNGSISTMEKVVSRGASIDDQGSHRSVSLELLPKICPDCEDCMRSTPMTAVMTNVRGTALHYAAAGGQDQAALWLFRAGAQLDVAATGFCGCRGLHTDLPEFPRWTVLHTAICHGKITTAEALIRLGAGVFRDPDTDTTALHSAAYVGSHHLVKLLLETHGSDQVTAQASSGLTPLHYAAGEPLTGHERAHSDHPAQTIDVITCLVKAGADTNASSSASGGPSRTPFSSAVVCMNWEACLALSNLGANLSKVSILAMLDNDMIQWGDTVHANDEHRIMILREAVRRGVFRENKSAWKCAILWDDWTAAGILLDSDFYRKLACQDPHTFARILHETDDHALCPGFRSPTWMKQREEVIRRLASTGLFEVDLPVHLPLSYHHSPDGTFLPVYGETCLTASITAGGYSRAQETELLSLLLDLGANPNTPNGRGMTLIHCLLEGCGRSTRVYAPYESLRLMLRHGASLDIRDADGKTPVDILIEMMATEEGRTWGFRVLTYLLKHVEEGCISSDLRVHAVDAAGEAAISLASEAENESIGTN